MSEKTPHFRKEFQQHLPDYTYVPGVTPHPAAVLRERTDEPEFVSRMEKSGRGRELFQHGFYWEAHEAWEADWIRAGRAGPRADFLKGLIKLAACGVKCLEQNEAGAIRHARRAAELFRNGLQTEPQQILSVSRHEIDQLIRYSEQLSAAPPLASDRQQQAAKQGGVPVLGPLPETDSQPMNQP